MKQAVYREAQNGLIEYQTDVTAVRDAERAEADAFMHMYYESLQEDWAADRRIMLQGFDPYTGERYTATQVHDLLKVLDLTYEERRDLDMRLLVEHDVLVDMYESEVDCAWSSNR